MKQSSYRHNSLSQAKRYNLSVGTFGGVDLTSQKFQVADSRSIAAQNYIYKQGFIQKRNGIEEIASLKNFTYYRINFATGERDEQLLTNENKFNGLWQFKAEDNEVHIVAHIGRLFFEITNIDSSEIEITPLCQSYYENKPVMYEFLNEKSSAFVGGNKLWILTGKKYMVLAFKEEETIFLPVEESGLNPTPTTTISITYTDSKVSGRQSYDGANLLSKWRKNKCITGTGKIEEKSTRYYEYVLDAPIVLERESDMSDIEIELEVSEV